MLTLIIPAYSAGQNIERTIKSCSRICNDVVIVSTAFFDEDKAALQSLGTVVELPWNFAFLHGFGSLHNQGVSAAKNDWLILLGVAETFAEPHKDIRVSLESSIKKGVFRCDHVNDPHTWKRAWNRRGGTEWSGIIHEEIINGADGGLLFRMQDTDKVQDENPVKREAYRWVKALSYNHLYKELLRDPSRLGGSGRGWLNFVAGAKESINDFCDKNAAMMEACILGDAGKFLALVEAGISAGEKANGVKFNPQGT